MVQSIDATHAKLVTFQQAVEQSTANHAALSDLTNYIDDWIGDSRKNHRKWGSRTPTSASFSGRPGQYTAAAAAAEAAKPPPRPLPTMLRLGDKVDIHACALRGTWTLVSQKESFESPPTHWTTVFERPFPTVSHQHQQVHRRTALFEGWCAT